MRYEIWFENKNSEELEVALCWTGKSRIFLNSKNGQIFFESRDGIDLEPHFETAFLKSQAAWGSDDLFVSKHEFQQAASAAKKHGFLYFRIC